MLKDKSFWAGFVIAYLLVLFVPQANVTRYFGSKGR